MRKLTLEEFVEKANKTHNNKYDYSQVVYFNGRSPVTIICPEHGPFQQVPAAHIHGKGCPLCRYKNVSKAKRFTVDKFIEKAREVHGDKYDYSKVRFNSMHDYVTIVCPLHGEFTQKAYSHLQKHGCPMCSRSKSNVLRKITTKEFIDISKKIHNNKYDYSESVYVNSKSKVKIICPIHGEFFQNASNHMKGSGCPICARILTKTKLSSDKYSFIEKAKQIHGDKYDYSKVDYVNCDTKVTIICPKHGEFTQVPYSHLNGFGCKKCSIENMRNVLTDTVDKFIEKAILVHSNKYDYSNVHYIDSSTKVKIVCPEHGEFEQRPNDHLDGHGCIKCSLKSPIQEQEIADFIETELGLGVLRNDRSMIMPKELDIYIPDYKVAIEHTGNYYHSSKFKRTNCASHLRNKFELCVDKGIKLFTIYEDEWLFKKDIVKSMIANAVGKTTPIYARKTAVKNIGSTEARVFLDANHIQGKTVFRYAYGLYYNDELVAVMTFTLPRLNMGRSIKDEPNSIELSRFCCKLNTRVVGGASKLLKAFINEHPEYTTIYSYSDNRISIGKLYQALGFEFTHNVQPNYFYINKKSPTLRIRKQKFRKEELKKQFNKSNGTELELTEELGYYRLYDAGKKCWTLNTNKKPAN